MKNTTMNTGAAGLSDEQREQLHLIERCDPSLLIHHIEEDTAYDGPLVARVFELAKERARALLATPAPQADAAPTGAMTRTQVQGKAIEHGFQYWRAPDAHGVTGTKPQAIELLQDLLGVEVEIEDNGCQTCNGTGMIGGPSYYAPDEGGEPCPDCAAIAAGGAQEAMQMLLSKVPIPPNAITFDKGWELLDELQRVALLAASNGEKKNV